VDNCEYCPVNTYEQNWLECIPCPENTVSPMGSVGITDCISKSGYYGLPGVEASICPAGSFCSLGIMRPTPCPDQMFSSEGAEKCEERQGFQLGLWEWITLWSWGVLCFLGIVCILGFRKSLFVGQQARGVPSQQPMRMPQPKVIPVAIEV
jgi:hypothetical protein